MADSTFRLTDMTRENYPIPCPDCRREHLNGEHVAFSVPAPEGGTRIAWEGCADCWIRRTNPVMSTRPTKEN